MTPGPLLLTAIVALAAAIVAGLRWPRAWLGLNLLASAAAFGAALSPLLGGPAWEWFGTVTVGGETPHLRVDAVSGIFLVLIAVVGAAGAGYSREYWSDGLHPASAPRSRGWWSGLVLCMVLVTTVSNGLHFLIAWEAFAVCGYFLITLERKRPAARAAGWLYLVASHAGTLGLFAFFSLLAARTGSWDLGPMRENADLAPLVWLVLFGFGVKAGVFGLHIWLPSAHANAPSHVSAIMSGVAIKMGIFGIVRFSGWLPTPTAAGWLVTGLGATGALLGIAFAFAQDDLKRLLAYCSVENIGIILMGVGGAMLAVSQGDAGWGRLALAGALLHVWNHGAFKTLLFLGAGSVLHGTGTRRMSRLGGLWRVMPWTAGFFLLGALAVAGLPPLNGFVSEWLVYLGFFDAVTAKGTSAWVAMPAVLMLALAGALALASFAKAGGMIFLGAPRTPAAARAHECGRWMRGPMLGLAAICLLIGLVPVLFWPMVARAVGAWHPAWNTMEAPAPIATLGSVQAALAGVIVVVAAGLWWRTRANGLRRALTWDCGYATPTARMQYSSGSFAGIGSGWFSLVLRPVRHWRRPRGVLPAGAFRLDRVPDVVLARVLTPMSDLILRCSTAVRRLQHGRLQDYILYVVAGLAVMAVLVSMGGVL
ncbi:MAG: NADH-quinone oxidoreductase subunit H [Verrucomicrobia bacterium]|nr:NADH-quinone oxidoreductase subunit H [Verrucomicrobiota bacterium]